MGIFRQAHNQSAYLKAGLLGFQGSGKTYTAVEIALGLHKHVASKRPIMFLDSETGSDWAIPRFEDAKVELLVAKTRAFSDLLAGVAEAEKEAEVLIIDSVSHFWKEMIEAYKKAHNIGPRMAFHHWAVLKPEWQRFSDAYVNSRLHCIVCGRAGWEWGHEEDEEGNKELRKLGTKMKVEGEFGFEPSLLLELERVKGGGIGDPILHRCYVIKDRRMDAKTMDGQSIDNPTFASFLPHVECLNLGGEHFGVDTTTSSEDIFAVKGESYTSQRRRSAILIEEINGELETRYPGTGKAEKMAKAAIKKALLGTYSDTAIESYLPDRLEDALDKIVDILCADDWSEQVDTIVAAESRKGKN